VFTRKAISNLEPLVVDVIDSIARDSGRQGCLRCGGGLRALFPVEVISSMLASPKEGQQQIRLWTTSSCTVSVTIPTSPRAG